MARRNPKKDRWIQRKMKKAEDNSYVTNTLSCASLEEVNEFEKEYFSILREKRNKIDISRQEEKIANQLNDMFYILDYWDSASITEKSRLTYDYYLLKKANEIIIFNIDNNVYSDEFARRLR